ncbi:hypothetical protein [Rhizorhapis sp. SPR117]|uniref:hypothetical protein n=1 Tax=Rhizorhapis sp. SPR117 TaxID=2912611 RepID=UPI001F1BBDB4|nr:hypothetical protein [Rhizorhapis sp. SPR117]
MNTIRAVKISLAWISIAWTACYLAFGLIPGLGPMAMPYVLHMNVPMENIFTIGNFIVGLIVWNVVVAAGVGLAGLLSNIIKA